MCAVVQILDISTASNISFFHKLCISLTSTVTTFTDIHELATNISFLKLISVQGWTVNDPWVYSWVFSRSCMKVQISSIYQLTLVEIVCVLLTIAFLNSEYICTSLRNKNANIWFNLCSWYISDNIFLECLTLTRAVHSLASDYITHRYDYSNEQWQIIVLVDKCRLAALR